MSISQPSSYCWLQSRQLSSQPLMSMTQAPLGAQAALAWGGAQGAQLSPLQPVAMSFRGTQPFGQAFSFGPQCMSLSASRSTNSWQLPASTGNSSAAITP